MGDPYYKCLACGEMRATAAPPERTCYVCQLQGKKPYQQPPCEKCGGQYSHNKTCPLNPFTNGHCDE